MNNLQNKAENLDESEDDEEKIKVQVAPEKKDGALGLFIDCKSTRDLLETPMALKKERKIENKSPTKLSIDKYIYLGCSKGQCIVLDLEEPEKLFARYMIGSVDSTFVQMFEIPD